MNLWGPDFFSDEELVAEIKAFASARKKVNNNELAVIAGEGRRIEFAPTKDRIAALNADLREMLAEARRRGLSIGGTAGGAIAVEIGLA